MSSDFPDDPPPTSGNPADWVPGSSADPAAGPEVDNSAIERERAAIAVLLASPKAIYHCIGSLEPEHFSDYVLGEAYRAILSLHEQGLAIDTPAVRREMVAENPKIDVDKLRHYLIRLAATATSTFMLYDYAAAIRNQWAVREAIAAGEHMAASSRAPAVKWREYIAEVDRVRGKLLEGETTERSAGQASADVMKQINDIYSGSAAPVATTTAFTALDRLTGGYRPGDLVVVAGRPGMGKSVFALTSARQVAAAGHAVSFHSLEIPERQAVARLMADGLADGRGQRPYFSEILRGMERQDGLSANQIEALWHYQREMEKLPLELNTATNVTVPEISASARLLKDRYRPKKTPLRVVFIDYLKFIKASERYRGQRHYEVGEITKSLKEMAKDLDVCVVLLCQLNRQVETRAGNRPELSDLRESGDIEADADVILFPFREYYYLAKGGDDVDINRQEEVKNTIEIIVAKNRSGETGTVNLYCDIGRNCIRDRDVQEAMI